MRRFIKMNVNINILQWLCILLLIPLSSCVMYNRNYSGPRLPKEEVAFLFNDFSLYGTMDYKDYDGYWIPCPDFHINYDGGYALTTLGYGLRCLEVLPGTYYVRVWKYRGDDEDNDKDDLGPFDGFFHPKAGHIYRLTKSYDIEKIWFITIKKMDDIAFEDVTSNRKYQKYIEEIKRK